MVSCSLHVLARPPRVLAALGVALAAWVTAGAAHAQAQAQAQDRELPQPLDRKSAMRIAAQRSQGAAAAHASARASRELAHAERKLPDPEVMAEAWQVPLSRPLAFGDASMVSVGVRQTLPAPGVLGARAEAREAEARAQEAMATDRARSIAREAGHAFVDVQLAHARHASHTTHLDVAARVVAIAQARLSSGAGRLADVAEAELETARLEADVAMEGERIVRAQSRLNGLLRRAFDAPLATTPLGEAETVAINESQVAGLAAANRPELGSARARKAAETASADAASREAAVPTFTVGAGWFAPTTTMPFHGYGLTLGATLPWLWGSASARSRAATESAKAAAEEAGELENQVRTEAAAALADVRAASRRLAVLRTRAKPAADAALEVALAGYQSGQLDAGMLVRVEKDVVETDIAILEAHAELAHALVDADWAAGRDLPRAPVSPATQGGAR